MLEPYHYLYYLPITTAHTNLDLARAAKPIKLHLHFHPYAALSLHDDVNKAGTTIRAPPPDLLAMYRVHVQLRLRLRHPTAAYSNAQKSSVDMEENKSRKAAGLGSGGGCEKG